MKNKKIYQIILFLVLIVLGFLFYKITEKFELNRWYKSTNSDNASNIVQFPNSEHIMSVHFLNVGHADSALIQYEGKNILIDSGWQDPASHVIMYCKSHGVEKFDLVIASHPHGDHIGEMSKIIETFPIDLFMIAEFQEGCQEKAHSSYKKMIKCIQKNKSIELKKVSAGEKFQIGNLKINVFSPSKKHNKINNNSLVLKITFGKRSFLFTGDCEKEAENNMLKSKYELKSDVLKVAHHGSTTSSQLKFLNAVQPMFSVISFGKTTYAAKPNKKTISNLKKINSKVLCTSKLGDIVFITDGKTLSLLGNAAQQEAKKAA